MLQRGDLSWSRRLADMLGAVYLGMAGTGPLIFQRLVLKLAYGPLFQLEDKTKLLPINWLSTNTIWSANFTKHCALI